MNDAVLRTMMTAKSVPWRNRWDWSAHPERKFSAAKKDDKAEILLYDQFGLSWWDGSGITAKDVSTQLKAFGEVKSINVRINSPGGDVFEADAVYTLLSQHPATVNVFIDGLAASAAAYVAMAGNTITIAEHAKMMIHNAWSLVMGNKADLRKAADVMEVFDSAISGIFVRRTGNTAADVNAWMDAESWFAGQEAVDRKFADSLMAGPAAEAPAAPEEAPKDFYSLEMMQRRIALLGKCA